MTSANIPTDETTVEIGGGREVRSYRSEWLTSPGIAQFVVSYKAG
jgi:hypothetical protein